MPPKPAIDSEDRSRRASQSAGFVVAAVLAAAGSFGLVFTAWHGAQEYSCALEGKINPNVASAASLARLPGIGLTRARAIVVFRDRVRHQTEATVVFRAPGDLQQVSGIGPATVAGASQWLCFD